MKPNILFKLDREKFSNLEELLIEILDGCDDWKNELKTKGRTLKEMSDQQVELLAKYEEKRLQVKTLADYIEFSLKKTKAKYFTELTKNASQAHTDRSKDKLIDSNVVVSSITDSWMLAQQTYEFFESICGQLKQRAYTINNLVKIAIEMPINMD